MSDVDYLLRRHLDDFRRACTRTLETLDGAGPSQQEQVYFVDAARSACWHLLDALRGESPPIPMILFCPRPECSARHLDEGAFANKLHHTHSCQTCGFTWRPAVVNTVGVRFLPGFKNEEDE